jgi:citronellyl-CoA dehydrogenase
MKITQQHIELKNSLSKFIDNEINPNVDKWEQDGIFPAKELFKKLGSLGVFGVTKPVEYGGLGLDYTYSTVIAEELGRIHCGGVPMAIGVQMDMATPALAKYGSKELCEEYLTPAITGDKIACIGVSEPNAGSDVAGLRTTAVKKGGNYIINGTKMWITNSTQADFICLLANTSEGPVHKNKSLIIVPMDLPGISISDKLDKLGMRSSDTAQIFFDDVKVPVRNLIGQENMGFIYQMEQFQNERLFSAANVLKGLEDIIQETIEYTSTRKTFGQPIVNNQAIQFRLVELSTEIELLRSLVYRCTDEFVAGKDITYLASMAKLKAGRLAREVSDTCLQYWGGMGYMWESRVARAYRDYRLLSIGAGADEIMINIISKMRSFTVKPAVKNKSKQAELV